MVNYKNKIIPALCFILLMLLVVSECRRRDENQTARKNIDAATGSVTYYKNKLGTQTATVKTLELDKQSLQNVLIKKDAELRMLTKEFASVKNVVMLKTVTQFDTIYIPFTEKAPCAFTRKDSVSTKNYSFNYEIDSAGLRLENFTVPNKVTVITGYKRKWFLGKQTLTTDITNSNPYITTQSMLSSEIVIPEPWYKKWYVWLAAGLLAGSIVR